MSDIILELDDIQGNILGGFNTNIQEHIVLSVVPSEFVKAAIWLSALAPKVTVVSQIQAERKRMKLSGDSQPTPWLFVALGQQFLKAVAPDVRIFDDGFNRGMVRRAPSLGDKTNPAEWKVGGTNMPVDIFIIIGSNDEFATTNYAEQLLDSIDSNILRIAWRETNRRLPNDIEHFGFRDGISQPLVRGFDSDGRLEAGNFIFGYPKVSGGSPYSPVMDERNLTKNGSLLVWRRLQQDVSKFYAYCDKEVKDAALQWPSFTREHLAAHLVGRWPSGDPIKAQQSVDPKSGNLDNNFDFRDDPEGKSCPFGAHIRKVNPRSGPKKDIIEIPRMIRRGIPFGPLYKKENSDLHDRGLSFISFQSSIIKQFEFLTQHWMNSFQKPQNGDDLLVGLRDGPRNIVINGPNGPLSIPGPESSWITPTGGAYLFAPGRSGLMKLADRPTVGSWAVKQYYFEMKTFIKNFL